MTCRATQAFRSKLIGRRLSNQSWKFVHADVLSFEKSCPIEKDHVFHASVSGLSLSSTSLSSINCIFTLSCLRQLPSVRYCTFKAPLFRMLFVEPSIQGKLEKWLGFTEWPSIQKCHKTWRVRRSSYQKTHKNGNGWTIKAQNRTQNQKKPVESRFH